MTATAPYRAGSHLCFPCGCAYQVASIEGEKPRVIRCSDSSCPQPNSLPQCRSCKAPILWATSDGPNAGAIPVDPVPPMDGGNLRLFRRNGRLMARHSAPSLLPGELYVSHFTSCPHAARHRRRR